MKTKTERQLNLLLPISSARGKHSVESRSSNSSALSGSLSDKRYLKIKESLKNKGLLKPR